MAEPAGPAGPTIAVALKWVDLRPDIDRVTGATHHDVRFFGCSAADQAALEHALRIGERFGWPVVAVSAGPAEADAVLRDALAVGASAAIRVDIEAGARSQHSAAALHDALATIDGLRLVCCGDWSLDRGSGSVPAFVAAHLGWGQALGLVGVDLDGDAGDGAFTVTRRLDQGRREVLRIDGPAVLSFEGGTAELRRAPLAAVLRTRDAAIVPLAGPPAPHHRLRVVHRGPDRPRARVLPPPDASLSPRERILALTGALVERTPPRTVVCEPDDAADLILDQLRAWGYLD